MNARRPAIITFLLAATLVSSGCLLGGNDDADGTDNSAGESPTATSTPESREYTVQAGDTLSGIAAQFDVSVALLQQVNGIADANHLEVGQTLVIPAADAPIPTTTAAATGTAGGTASPTATATATPSSGCDRSYPDVCIPPAPPLLTCDQIDERNFRVVAPDPHNFDQNNNGFGCDEES
jgi:LysM repeat protein